MSNITSQEELFSQIQRLITNHKKTSSSRYTESYLKTRIQSLEEYWSQFLSEHREILKATTTNEDGKELKELYNHVEDLYMDFKTSLLEQLEPKRTQNVANVAAPTPQIIAKSKLPPINIPSFSGDYQQWMHFKDLFLSLIHNETGLSDIQKHHYLRSSLKGEAEQLVRHIEITAVNYGKAWNTLVSRYSNDRVIANTILNRLLTQKKLTYECPKGIKDLLDTTNQCLSSLASLKIDTTSWDPIIVHTVVSKLDYDTHKAWEQSLGSSIELPTYKSLTSFLEGRFRAMEMLPSQKKEKRDLTYQPQVTAPYTKNVKSFTTEIDTECTYCKKHHYICHCTEFSQLDIEQRKEFVKNNNLCFNCLVKGHSIRNCRQTTSCKTCNRKHHTLLHYDSITPEPLIAESALTEPNDTQNKTLTSLKVSISDNQVILATAMIGVIDCTGSLVYLRALVDQGSQATFITESAVQLLRLKKTPQSANVTGIGSRSVQARHVVNLDIYSPIDTHHVMQVNAHVLSKLTPSLPTKEFDISQWPALSQFKLADPHMHRPGPIDVLLGADVYANILLQGMHKFDTLLAQNSKLGWLVSGATHLSSDLPPHNITIHHARIEVDQLLHKFWKTEEYTLHEKPMTLLDTQCEEHYKKTHNRQEDVVGLPFEDEHEEDLTHSRSTLVTVLQKVDQMEDVNPQHKPAHKVTGQRHLARHMVITQATHPSDGSSLNVESLVVPPLLPDLCDLITRWYTRKICLLTDRKQMIHEIPITKADVDFLRILCLSSPQDNIVEKRLLTVTYTSCAPFLAIRTLKQFAYDEKSVITDYILDLLTCAKDEEQVMQSQQRVIHVMAESKFGIHKWAANSPDVLTNIPIADRAQRETVDIMLNNNSYALGIRWNSHRVVFEIKLDISKPTERSTKTSVLSNTARACDFIGFLESMITTAIIFLLKLWLSRVKWKWTDELSLKLVSVWSSYRDQRYHIPNLNLELWVRTKLNGNDRLDVHGFRYASSLAYTSVVCLQVVTHNRIHIFIVIF